jgi:hypothetical protein
MAISPLRSLAAALFGLALAACSSAPAPAPTPGPDGPRVPDASATGLLLDQRGVAMSLEKAVREIAFRPFLPPVHYIAVAVIPPLGNDDLPANRGIAFEYGPRGAATILSEWPKQSFQISVAGRDASAAPCKPIAYSQNGVVWTTPHGLVMTLQPDGRTSAAAIAARARALIAHGACR